MHIRRPQTLRVLAAVLCSLVFAPVPKLHALSAVPVVVELRESGPRKAATLKVYNDADRAVPVELRVNRMDVTEHGRIVRSASDGNLIVFPPRALVAPGDTQIVNVVWQGDKPLTESRSYTITAREVLVEPEQQSRIQNQVALHLTVIANVAPRDGTADLNVIDIETQSRAAALPQGSGSVPDVLTRKVAITIENTGTMHGRFTSGSLRLSGGDWEATLTTNDLLKLSGVGIVQPGKQRRFVVPIQVPSSVGALQVTYQPPR
jgi:P pilus assembly chaperone PapD